MAGVGEALNQFFQNKREQMRLISPYSLKLLDAIEELTHRKGKRLRPIILYAGAQAVCAHPNELSLWQGGAALELLQTYLLIHDDWMDQDNERRGGKSVHVQFAETTQNHHLGASLAVLAGDLASAYAWELTSKALAAHSKQSEGLKLFARMHQEVVMGQYQDMMQEGDIHSMYDLKTGSYSVRGPLLLGGILGEANPQQLQELEAFAYPLGIAFQLRDDLLGTFGDAEAIGKPVGNDLRRGKFTALITEAHALLSQEERVALDAIMNNPSSPDTAIIDMVHVLKTRGIRDRIEKKIQTLTLEAETLLQQAHIEPSGRLFLQELVSRLTNRNH